MLAFADDFNAAKYISQDLTLERWPARWDLPPLDGKCHLLNANVDQVSNRPLRCMLEPKDFGVIVTDVFQLSRQLDGVQQGQTSIGQTSCDNTVQSK